MTNEPPYTTDLFDALDDMVNKVREHCAEIPTSVQSSLAYADYALARARIERKKHDITD